MPRHLERYPPYPDLVLDDDGYASKPKCPSQWIGGLCSESSHLRPIASETVSTLVIESAYRRDGSASWAGRSRFIPMGKQTAVFKFRDNDGVELLLKKLCDIIRILVTHLGNGLPVRYWCEDESRFGLKTPTGRLITLRGVKPHGWMRWRRDNLYLYGVV
jgi:hypothetical protein